MPRCKACVQCKEFKKAQPVDDWNLYWPKVLYFTTSVIFRCVERAIGLLDEREHVYSRNIWDSENFEGIDTDLKTCRICLMRRGYKARRNTNNAESTAQQMSWDSNVILTHHVRGTNHKNGILALNALHSHHGLLSQHHIGVCTQTLEVSAMRSRKR